LPWESRVSEASAKDAERAIIPHLPSFIQVKWIIPTFLIAIMHPIVVVVVLAAGIWLVKGSSLDIRMFVPNSKTIGFIVLFLLLFPIIILIIKGYKFVSKRGYFSSLVYTFCLSCVLTMYIVYFLCIMLGY
jgi:hypothetical protein